MIRAESLREVKGTDLAHFTSAVDQQPLRPKSHTAMDRPDLIEGEFIPPVRVKVFDRDDTKVTLPYESPERIDLDKLEAVVVAIDKGDFDTIADALS